MPKSRAPVTTGGQNEGMRFLVTTVLNALALWLVVLLLGGLEVTPYHSDNPQFALVVTYGILAVVWGLVNSIIGRIVKVLSIPLYVITLGLFAFVVNGALFWLVAWISQVLGFGLTISNFWWAIFGAILMSIFSGILNGLFNRGGRRGRSRERND